MVHVAQELIYHGLEFELHICTIFGLIGFSLVGEQIFPTGYCPIDRESEGLRFNVVIREDAKVSPFTVCYCKGSTFYSFILRP